MLERLRLASSNADSVQKRVFDVNVLAVFLAKGHPGFEYVSPVVEAGLRGVYVPVVMDVLPLRAFWVMTRRWGLPEKECSASVEHFVKTYDVPRYSALGREAILEGFQLAEELKHDVFDCMYLALARQEKAKGIVTTDTDFERLCKHTGLEYFNPVPKEVLKRFKEQNK
jgi:predicted nucleic acid-binding protein